MNLYKIVFEHFAPRDSKEGIATYLLAQSDEEVYECLKSEPRTNTGDLICSNYKYHEEDDEIFDIYDDNYRVIGKESFKEKMIRMRGDIHDPDVDVSDAYYGVTLYGWECIKDDIKPDALKMIEDNGIQIIKSW